MVRTSNKKLLVAKGIATRSKDPISSFLLFGVSFWGGVFLTGATGVDPYSSGAWCLEVLFGLS